MHDVPRVCPGGVSADYSSLVGRRKEENGGGEWVRSGPHLSPLGGREGEIPGGL